MHSTSKKVGMNEMNKIRNESYLCFTPLPAVSQISPAKAWMKGILQNDANLKNTIRCSSSSHWHQRTQFAYCVMNSDFTDTNTFVNIEYVIFNLIQNIFLVNRCLIVKINLDAS